MIRVVIADDQQMIRSGLKTILESQGDIKVVGEAPDGEAVVEMARIHSPDVVLMDIRMPKLDGIEATKLLPTTKVLVLTTFHLDEYVLSALAAGASGFLLKDATSDQLISAIRSIAEGDAVLSPSVTKALLDYVRTRAPSSLAVPTGLGDLSPREREVLGWLALGLSNAEISKKMYLSEATVKTHISRLLSKLNLRDRVQAVVFAHRYGLVAPTEYA